MSWAPEEAPQIARRLKWLTQAYAAAGMVDDRTRAERDSQWWLTYYLGTVILTG